MPEEWFYCLEHKTVERRGECRVDQRLGPFDSREAARRALEKVEQRNDDWDDDPAWKDDDD